MEELVRLTRVTKRFGGSSRARRDLGRRARRRDHRAGRAGRRRQDDADAAHRRAARPDGGALTVCGFDPAKDAAWIQASIGYMPQRFGLYEDLSVQENLDLYADLRGLPEGERADVVRRAARLHRSRALHGSPGGQALRRNEAEARPRLRPDPQAAAAAARRAERRRRPDLAARAVEDGERAGGRGHRRGVEHGLSRRGRGVRPRCLLLERGQAPLRRPAARADPRTRAASSSSRASRAAAARSWPRALDEPDVIDGVIQGRRAPGRARRVAPPTVPADAGPRAELVAATRRASRTPSSTCWAAARAGARSSPRRLARSRRRGGSRAPSSRPAG